MLREKPTGTTRVMMNEIERYEIERYDSTFNIDANTI